MRRIPVSPLTFDAETHLDPENFELASKTEPDQTLPLKQLLARYSRGQHVPTFEPVYDDSDLPDVSRLSKVEMEELSKEITSTIKYEKERLQHEADLKQKVEAPDPEQYIDFSDPTDDSDKSE